MFVLILKRQFYDVSLLSSSSFYSVRPYLPGWFGEDGRKGKRREEVLVGISFVYFSPMF